MSVNILLFTQTMHSLLSSSLQLQDALSVCSEILTSRRDREFSMSLLKQVNEGKKLGEALRDSNAVFSALYISLVSIGEESGTLSQVFGKLSGYLKDKKDIHQCH